MTSPIIQWKRLSFNTLPLPAYQSEGAAGFDLQACLTDLSHLSDEDERDLSLTLPPMGRDAKASKTIIRTGFQVAIPDGYELQIRPRSGVAINNEIIILNSPGTIDSDYRGEIMIGVKNIGTQDFVIRHGMRIAQAVLAPVIRAEHVETASLPKTLRGTGGFGSTGT